MRWSIQAVSYVLQKRGWCMGIDRTSRVGIASGRKTSARPARSLFLQAICSPRAEINFRRTGSLLPTVFALLQTGPPEERDMLVITRREGQNLMIGDEVIVTIVEIRAGQVRIGIKAPLSVAVHREEVWRRIENEKHSAV